MIDESNASLEAAAAQMTAPFTLKSPSVSERRAALMVRCAREIAGATLTPEADISVPLSVLEFERELRARYGSTEPELVFRTDSTLERARLDRTRLKHLPKVILRQGAPRRHRAVAWVRQSADDEAMNSKELQQALARLHEELQRSPGVDEESRGLLRQVMRDAERLQTLAPSDPPDERKHRLETLAVAFEAEHPRLAATLREFINLLSQAGM